MYKRNLLYWQAVTVQPNTGQSQKDYTVNMELINSLLYFKHFINAYSFFACET